MSFVVAIIYLGVGWLTGIAINHAADVLPTRRTIWQWPRCSNCGTRRAISAWSALIAYLKHQGRCHHCSQRRETQKRSILVELTTPLFFIFLLTQYGLTVQLGLVSVYTAILILITVTDLEHRLIFNVVILPAILLGLAAAFLTPNSFWRSAVVGGAFAFVVMYVLALVSRGGLGEGDVTLSAFLGVILGFPFIILSLFFGIFLAGFVLILLLITRRVGMKSLVPYGPFLTTTGWIMLIWGPEIWNYYF